MTSPGSTVSIRVVVRDMTRGGVGSARNSLDGLAGSLGRLGGGAGAIQGLVGVAGAAQQLAGAALILPGVLGAAAAILGTFQIALSGVSAALGATSSGTGAAAVNMAGFARQVRDANRRIEDAQRGVADANRRLDDSYRAVADAERQVAQAKKQVASAQKDYAKAQADEQDALAGIDTARKAAIRTLEDLIETQDDSVRNVKGSSLALQRAEADLVKVNKDVKSTSLDRAEAQFKVEQAQDSLSDAEKKAADDTTALNEAQAKGIEGSDEVVAAQKRAAEAHERTVDAAERVADAMEGVADAERGVEDANRGVEDAQRGVDDAHRNVAEALEALDDVYKQHDEQMAQSAGGIDAYADAMSKISPEARQLVETIRGLADEWQGLQFAVQDAAFDGMAEQVQALANQYIPDLTTGLSGIASQLNDMASYAIDQLLDPDVVASVNKVLSDTAKFLDNASTSVGDFIAGFLQMAGIGSGFLPQMGEWIAGIAADFREWVESDPSAIQEFIQNGLDGFGSLFEIIGNVVDIFGGLISGLAAGGSLEGEDGGGFLGWLASVTEAIANFVNDPTVQAILGFIGMLATAVIELLPYWAPLAAGMYLVSAAMAVVNAVMSANPFGLVVLAIGALVAALIYAWNNSETFRNIVTGVFNAIGATVSAVVNGVVVAWNWMANAISGVVNWVRGALSSMWDGLGNGLKAAVNGAIWLLNGLISGVNGVISGLNSVNPFGSIGYVPYVSYLAKGGISGGGLAMVGERGPELVNLPTGSTVYPTGQSMGMLDKAARNGGGGGGQLGLNFTGDTDSSVATMLMSLVRSGAIQLTVNGDPVTV